MSIGIAVGVPIGVIRMAVIASARVQVILMVILVGLVIWSRAWLTLQFVFFLSCDLLLERVTTNPKL